MIEGGKILEGNGRIKYIDAVETISMFLVIYCHYPELSGTSAASHIAMLFATTFAMPMFFICNGALLLNKKDIDVRRHLKKTFMLYVSTVLWKIIYIAVVLSAYPASVFEKFKTSILYCLLGNCRIDGLDLAIDHFWFTNALIAVYLIFPLIKFAYDKSPEYIKFLAVLLFVFDFLLVEYNFWADIMKYGLEFEVPRFDTLKTTMYPFAEAASYLLYFILGGIVHRKFHGAKIGTGKRISLIAIIAVSYAYLLYAKFVQMGTLSGTWYRLEGDYHRIGTLAMAVSAYILFATADFSKTKTANKIFFFVSLRTMNIYCVHMLLCYLFDKYFLPYISVRGVFPHAAKTLAVMLVSILITEPLTYIPPVRKLLNLQPDHKKTTSEGV